MTLQDKTPKMMAGSEEKLDYALVAVSGSVWLGVKFLGMIDGAKFNMPDTTWIDLRLRSAPAPEDTSESNVVAMPASENMLSAAWPEVKWTKSGEKRCSTHFGVLIRGNTTTNLDALIERCSKGDIANKLAEYVTSAAGADYVIGTKAELADIFQSLWFNELSENLAKSAKAQKAAIEVMTESLDHFTDQTSLLAKLYNELAPDGDPATANDGTSAD